VWLDNGSARVRAVFRRSSLHGNRMRTGAGAGLYAEGRPDAQPLSIGFENSTITDNEASHGAAMYLRTSLRDSQLQVVFANTTVARNVSAFGVGGVLVQDQEADEPVRVVARNSIFYGNSNADCHTVDGASFVSQGYNVFGVPGECESIALDRVGENPLLGILGLHGGLTPSLPIGADGAAHDVGHPDDGCLGLDGAPLTEDQRGQARPNGAATSARTSASRLPGLTSAVVCTRRRGAHALSPRLRPTRSRRPRTLFAISHKARRSPFSCRRTWYLCPGTTIRPPYRSSTTAR